jgi:hypothetical protein
MSLTEEALVAFTTRSPVLIDRNAPSLGGSCRKDHRSVLTVERADREDRGEAAARDLEYSDWVHLWAVAILRPEPHLVADHRAEVAGRLT